jgi:hypothetical protein
MTPIIGRSVITSLLAFFPMPHNLDKATLKTFNKILIEANSHFVFYSMLQMQVWRMRS